MSKIKSAKLQEAVKEINNDFYNATRYELEQSILEVSKEATNVAKREAEKYKWKKYPKNIKATKIQYQNGQPYAVVYVGGQDYRLAHLLENGHALVRGGRKVGEVKAYPHLIQAEEYAEKELPEVIKRKVEG